jgi:hypothetical protein
VLQVAFPLSFSISETNDGATVTSSELTIPVNVEISVVENAAGMDTQYGFVYDATTGR